MKARKGRYVVALVVCVGAIAWMVTSLSANLNYMMTVSEAVSHRPDKGTETFRVGGVVKRGSIDARSRDGAVFVLTDGPAAMKINLQATPPDLFKDCAPIIVQGHWKDAVFVGDQVLVQHGATYDNKQHPVGKTLVAAGCPDTTKA